MKFETKVCALSLALSFMSAPAFAQATPDGCRDSGASRNGRAYQQGKSAGDALVQAAWKQLKSCTKMRTVAELVRAGLKAVRPSSNARAGICLYAGAIDGVFAGLDRVWSSCTSQCCQEGEIIGQMSGELYCDLSILLGGLGEPEQFIRGPVDSCGADFQLCCDAKFIDTTRRYSARGADGKTAQCLPYTRGDHQQVWSDTRALECAYEPIPVEPED